MFLIKNFKPLVFGVITIVGYYNYDENPRGNNCFTSIIVK